LQEGCLINKKRGNLFAIPLEKLKVKKIYKKQLTALKTVRGSSSNKVLSLYTTCDSSQSREAVPLNVGLLVDFEYTVLGVYCGMSLFNTFNLKNEWL
jgi:hypothetical protein